MVVLRNIEKQLDRYITAMALHSGALRGEINTANENNCPRWRRRKRIRKLFARKYRPFAKIGTVFAIYNVQTLNI